MAKMSEILEITRKKYNWYKEFDPDTLTDLEKAEIDLFEKNNTPEISEKTRDYFERLKNPNPAPIFNLEYDNLLIAFLKQFKLNENIKFKKDRLDQVNTILYYFSQDKRFFECENLSKLSKPSFDKGLLIIGGFGTGKSASMNCLNVLFKGTPLVFGKYTAKNLVEQYEYTPKENKKAYMNKIERANRMYIDDLKTERLANNYGIKVNLLEHILFHRAENKQLTFATCNYNIEYPGDLKKAIDQFSDYYSYQVHDRIYQMFNIIEFNGKSLRI